MATRTGGAAQERWLAGNWSLDRPWNLLTQQTLMMRFDWGKTAMNGRYETDGWPRLEAVLNRIDPSERRILLAGRVLVS